MSSALFSAVPAFTGSNYKDWSLAMESYLKATGLWSAISTKKPAARETVSLTASNKKEVAEWVENNMKTCSSIQLRLSPSVRASLKFEDSAAAIWQSLKENYSHFTLSNTYHKFKGLLDTYIPTAQHPAPALNKMQAHWEALMAVKTVSHYVVTSTATCTPGGASSASASGSAVSLDATEPLPKWLYAMLIIAKLPAPYTIIAQMCRQKKPSELDIQDIRCQILMVWDQRSSHRTPKNAKAKKLSAVKRKPGDPSFSSQTKGSQQPMQLHQPSWPQQPNAGHNSKEKKNCRCPNNKGKGHAHAVDGEDLMGHFASPVVASSGSAPKTSLPSGSSSVRPELVSMLPTPLNAKARPYVPDRRMTQPVV
jgi:hypothetical protein